ncbi:VOC family protein [Streptomyces sp. NPDC050085]|uniref:VOC family protein n=1 Tax=Streptomyces sp. NPDC050085 TaxID=3365600 RepID=UPI003799BB00
MTVELNHTIVPARDPQASARFLADILGLSVDPPVAHFTPVTLNNHVSLDYDQVDDFEPHHYAFMVGEEEFDAAFARIQSGGITYYGDPACREIGQIYHSKHVEGRRGTYFRDPSGHLMEILTAGRRD